MIIRSQDKKTISDDMNLKIQGREVGKIEFFSIRNSKDVCLGSYKTIEKAIKVLDMICAFVTDKYYEKVVPEQCGCIGGVVFEMPQDSEV